MRNSEDSSSNVAWVYQERQILLARKMPRAWTNLLKVFGPRAAAMSFTGETSMKGLQGVTITADASPGCSFHPQKNARPSLQLLTQKVPKNHCWRNVPLFLLGFTASFQHLWADTGLSTPCFDPVQTPWCLPVLKQPGLNLSVQSDLGIHSFQYPPLQPSCSPWAL